MTTVKEIINLLEEKATLLQKTQSNLKKCPKQRLTKGYIETRLKGIEEDWKLFKSYHEALVKTTPKEERINIPYFVNEDYYVIEDLYLCLTGDLRDMLMTFNKTSETSHLASEVISQVKLPSIQLPTFGGQYEDWTTFNDLFTSLVHQNTTLTKVQKLHYLKSSLTGEAESLLKHLYVTESNYEQAWDILKQRYGNKRLIVNSILKRLFGQKKVTSTTANQIKTLVDTTSECLNSLHNLQVSTEAWDPMTIYIVIQKLDTETHKAWEDHIYSPDSEKLPTWQELKNFLEAKFRTLELMAPTSCTKEYKPARVRTFHISAPAPVKTCILCNEAHTVCHCKEFTKLNVNERSDLAKEKKLCFNCLVPGHSAKRCRLRMSCRICKRRHHSLLHQTNPIQPESGQTEETQANLVISSYSITKNTAALLATALVPVENIQGQRIVLRALIDQGSQANFVTERAAQMLGLKRMKTRGTITGVGSTKAEVKQVVQLQLLSRYEDTFLLPVQAYVMPTQLTSQLPSKSFIIQTHDWSHLRNINLADPSFNTTGRVDMLLGVEVYAQIVKSSLIRGPPNSPCAQETSFGWILFGEIQNSPHDKEIVVMHHQLDNILYKLWEIDNFEENMLTKEEKACEEFYLNTHQRNEDGRYVVKLPFKTTNPKCTEGNTKDIARNRLIQLERRLERNPKLKIEYSKVMEDYLTLQHMEEVPKEEIENPAVYLPHHAVVKEESDTTKVRVVFNASSPGSNKISLNDELLVGPVLQDDMRSILMRFRLKRIGYVADIQKMYRMVILSKEDIDYQRILWRSDKDEEIKDYRLLTVTFGTASAPYLAVRSLQQVADDEGQNNPKAAETIKSNFWMDDLMSGQDTVEEAIEVAQGVREILKKGGFPLQKWSSNSAKFLQAIDSKEINSRVKVSLNVGGTVKTLGLSWNLEEDNLQYNCTVPAPAERLTKRNILAEVQHVFDPLGWLSPTFIAAKILLQGLWLRGATWDEELQPEIKEEWLKIRQSFEELNEIKIQRWLNTNNENLPEVAIHGFCDASTKAYGAVAYLRVRSKDGQYTTSLIASRARVAPIKPVSLPRLELCGAVLLSKLLKHISLATRIPFSQIYAWSDSTIVLSWLRGDPGRWQTFVRNRVVTILDNVGHKWYHVASQDNPADIASRGMTLKELKENRLWWQGPDWLRNEHIDMHQVQEYLEGNSFDLEKKKIKHISMAVTEQENNEKSILTQFEEYEDLNDLLKTIVYCKRFFKAKKQHYKSDVQPISTEELHAALEDCVKISQAKEFGKEVANLQSNKAIENKSHTKNLNPFLDHQGILRVGGRLRHAHIPEDTKYPMIVSNRGQLASLIVKNSHKRTLHGGIQLTMNEVRSRFWIPRLKTLVATTIHKCWICARHRATTRNQLMGDLPASRVKPARPFLNAGVDFAGPLQILKSKGRGSRCEKAYICIFVCMATKAVHLELVGDLSTTSFIGAFKRFVSRRGHCAHIWSDRGTNFVGASKELTKMWNESKLEMPQNLLHLLAEDGTQWHFNPPYSPNFGGLWEAGVKSIKHHLKRILTMNLTFEEMTTTLCQIEACLNSRPLCPIDGKDTESLAVLTPGHFLIGEAPINIPEPDLKDVSWNRLSRWQHTRRLVQHFWTRWLNEYLTRLQQRPKWCAVKDEFSIGDVVLMKEENLPPGKWALGRITEKHTGADNMCRVYSLKCGDKIIKRSVSKLCALPMND